METTEKQTKGLEYESFIMDWFTETKRISLSHYTTKEDQFLKGENRQGIEIKNDQMFAKTGNLFISIQRDYGYTKHPSGIYKDQSWLYLIGNKEVFYIFSTKQLKQYFEANSPKLFSGFISNKNGIEKGFLLNTKLADRLCIEKVTSQIKLF
tara:strand:+ start:1742 stop:2197 length:456 start_codon:yes stop_codon:yes gene_type:complete